MFELRVLATYTKDSAGPHISFLYKNIISYGKLTGLERLVSHFI